jgi:hypothetical protein
VKLDVLVHKAQQTVLCLPRPNIIRLTDTVFILRVINGYQLIRHADSSRYIFANGSYGVGASGADYQGNQLR